MSPRAACLTLISACMFVLPVQAAPKWPLPEGVKSIEVNGYEMAYQEMGSGDPIVLIHGTLNDYRAWSVQVPVFAKKYRVIAISLRHHYPEKWDGRGDDYSIEQHVADLVLFISKLNLGRVHLLGHSRGGAVALNVARVHAEVIKTLILEDSSGLQAILPEDPESQKLAVQARENRDALARNLAAGNAEWAVQVFIDSLNGAGTFAKIVPERRQLFLDNIGTAREGDGRPDMTCGDVARLDFPILLLNGERSPQRYDEMFAAMRKCNASIAAPIVIPNAAHAMHVQNPTVFNSIVLDFLARH